MEVSDLQFRLINKFRCFDPPLSSTQFGRKLVGTSSYYGFSVVAGPQNKLFAVKTTDLLKVAATGESECSNFPHREIDFFIQDVEIFSIDFNCEGKVFSVAANTPNGPFVYMFDALTLAPEYQQIPFPLSSIRLSTNSSSKLTAFEWNPMLVDFFIVACTDLLSCIQYFLTSPNSFTMVASKPMSVCCISWSPKGKQVTVGDSAGRIHQMKPELDLVRTIEPPTIDKLGAGNHACAGLIWLSTTEWAVVHANADKDVSMSVVTVKKNQQPTWEQWPGMYPPIFNQVSSKNFSFYPLFGWQFIFATSTCFSDVVVLANDGNKWNACEVKEPFVIQCPAGRNGAASQILGASFDFSSPFEVALNTDGSKLPPQPIMYLMTTDGVLMMYHVASLNEARPPLVKPSVTYSIGDAINGQQPSWFSLKVATQKRDLFGTPVPAALIFGQAAFSQANQSPVSTFQKAAVPDQVKKTDESSAKEDAETARLAREADQTKRIQEMEVARKAQEAEAAKKAREEEAARKIQEAAKAQETAKQVQEDAQRNAMIAKKNQIFLEVTAAAGRAIMNYKTAVCNFHQLRLLLEENAQQNVDFDQNIETYFKCIDSVKVIATVIQEDAAKHAAILKNLRTSVVEINTVLTSDFETAVVPEWVTEFSENLDEMDDRLFKLTEVYKKCEKDIVKVDKILKNENFKVPQKTLLDKDEEQLLAVKNKDVAAFIARLSKKLSDARTQCRLMAAADNIKKTKEVIRSAGGQLDLSESVLQDDSVADSSYSMVPELSFNFSAMNVCSDMARDDMAGKTEGIKKLLDLSRLRTNMPVKVAKPILLHDFLAKKEVAQKQTDNVVLHPKVAEARKTLVGFLTGMKRLEKIPNHDQQFVDNFVKQNLSFIPPKEPARKPMPVASASVATGSGQQNVVTPTADIFTITAVPIPANESVLSPSLKKVEKAPAKDQQRDDNTPPRNSSSIVPTPVAVLPTFGAVHAESEMGQQNAVVSPVSQNSSTNSAFNQVDKSESHSQIPSQETSTFGGGFSDFANKSGGFGAVAQQSDQQQPPPPAFGGFGSPTSAGGQQNAVVSPFAQSSAITTPFNQENKSAFGQNSQTPAQTTSAFGGGFSAFANKSGGLNAIAQQPNQQQSAFGGFGSISSAFGQQNAVVSPFAQNSSINSAFNQSNKSAFGQNSQTPAQTTSPFGGEFSGFANKSGGFGAVAQQTNQQQPSAFGGFGSTSSAFGQQNAGASPFAQNSSTNSAFNQGNKSAFGQNSQTPAQTTSTFGGGFSAFANKSGGFGAIAQQSNQQQQPSTFGGFGQTSNLFDQSKKNAFSAWRN